LEFETVTKFNENIPLDELDVVHVHDENVDSNNSITTMQDFPVPERYLGESGSSRLHKIRRILRQIYVYGISVFLLFITTLGIFPGLTSRLKSSHQLGLFF
jgi:hypothetical protein